MQCPLQTPWAAYRAISPRSTTITLYHRPGIITPLLRFHRHFGALLRKHGVQRIFKILSGAFSVHACISRPAVNVIFVASLLFFLAVAFLSPCVDVKSVPDASVFRRVERAGPHAPSALLNSTCQLILNSLSSSSAVYAPGTCEYDEDLSTPRSASLLIRLTQKNTGPAHQLNMPRVQSNQATCKIFPL